MPGDETDQIEVLNREGPLSGKLPRIMDIIRGEDQTTKRQLAEWLLTELPRTVERNNRLVSILALARVEATLRDEEFLSFVRTARDFYGRETESLRDDDDPLLAIATNATAEQRTLLVTELTPLLEGEGVLLRNATMAALIKIVALTEIADARASLATSLQAHARDGESGDIQKALKRKKA